MLVIHLVSRPPTRPPHPRKENLTVYVLFNRYFPPIQCPKDLLCFFLIIIFESYGFYPYPFGEKHVRLKT